MSRTDRQKLKLLYLKKILSEETDEKHPMPMSILLNRLAQEGIEAERKSIYHDLECLNLFGEDITFNNSRTNGGYFLATRTFELPELKIMVDAVLSSKFITENKSHTLISKIEKLTSKQEAVQLQRQLYNTGRIKNENESIYYHIDAIEIAIQNNKKIEFQYMAWNLKKHLEARRNGEKYLISPWSLIWSDENYYLIGYDENATIIKHFRVDKMGMVKVTEASRTGREKFEVCDMETYSSKTFGMYGGREEMVTIKCANSIVGVMLDRFGRDTMIKKIADDHFEIHVKVAVSNQFFGWLTGIGSAAFLAGPEQIQKEYKNYLKHILLEYDSSF